MFLERDGRLVWMAGKLDRIVWKVVFTQSCSTSNAIAFNVRGTPGMDASNLFLFVLTARVQWIFDKIDDFIGGESLEYYWLYFQRVVHFRNRCDILGVRGRHKGVSATQKVLKSLNRWEIHLGAKLEKQCIFCPISIGHVPMILLY